MIHQGFFYEKERFEEFQFGRERMIFPKINKKEST